ncbi:amidohydrolase family protein [Merdibacter massiliensis]|uniref:amidohydrolase family protein n=1 Tax=Merdibacter massiliensis TaxID=1871030 RepID=UPI00096A334F|nr:amidohydrolase family protein [Merdibacter massiliensis]
MIIDFHAHVDRDPITKKYHVEELLQDMKENGIEKRVISTFFGSSIASANDKIIELVRQYPERLIGCAVINPKLDDAVDEVKRVSKFSEIRMIEFNSLEHGYRPEKFAYNICPILKVCEERHLVVKMFTGQGFYTMPEQWVYYTKQFSNVRFVIEHLGGSDYAYGTVDLCKEKENENLMLETSYETEIPSLNRAFSELSADRFLYGSNYPSNFTKLSIMKFNTLNLSDEFKNKMFYENAKKILNI